MPFVSLILTVFLCFHSPAHSEEATPALHQAETEHLTLTPLDRLNQTFTEPEGVILRRETTIKDRALLYCSKEGQVRSAHLDLIDKLNASPEAKTTYLLHQGGSSIYEFKKLPQRPGQSDLMAIAYRYPLTPGARDALYSLMHMSVDRGELENAYLYSEKLLRDYPSLCEEKPTACKTIIRIRELVGKAIGRKDPMPKAAGEPLAGVDWVGLLGAPDLRDSQSVNLRQTQMFFLLALFGSSSLDKILPDSEVLEGNRCENINFAFRRPISHKWVRWEKVSTPAVLHRLMGNKASQAVIEGRAQGAQRYLQAARKLVSENKPLTEEQAVAFEALFRRLQTKNRELNSELKKALKAAASESPDTRLRATVVAGIYWDLDSFKEIFNEERPDTAALLLEAERLQPREGIPFPLVKKFLFSTNPQLEETAMKVLGCDFSRKNEKARLLDKLECLDHFQSLDKAHIPALEKLLTSSTLAPVEALEAFDFLQKMGGISPANKEIYMKAAERGVSDVLPALGEFAKSDAEALAKLRSFPAHDVKGDVLKANALLRSGNANLNDEQEFIIKPLLKHSSAEVRPVIRALHEAHRKKEVIELYFATLIDPKTDESVLSRQEVVYCELFGMLSKEDRAEKLKSLFKEQGKSEPIRSALTTLLNDQTDLEPDLANFLVDKYDEGNQLLKLAVLEALNKTKGSRAELEKVNDLFLREGKSKSITIRAQADRGLTLIREQWKN